MPIHDWTRVRAGVFHSFHIEWMGSILHTLNNGLLPDDYYALIEPDAECLRLLIVRRVHDHRTVALVEIVSPQNKVVRHERADEPCWHRLDLFELSFVAYACEPRRSVYVKQLAVGDVLPAMPLFLTASEYVTIPLEESYQQAFLGVPRFYRTQLQ